MSLNDRMILQNCLKNDLPDFSDKRLIVWGAGNTAMLSQQGLKRFAKDHPWFVVSAYCDSAEEKWGTVFCGKPVMSPEQLLEENDDRICTLICAQTPGAVRSIRKQLGKMNLPFYLLDEVILKTEAEKVMQCYDLLEDAASRKIYQSVICARIMGSEAPEGFETEPLQYFSHPVLKRKRKPETLVDCGAYNGDTLDDFLSFEGGSIGRYIAFESDAENYRLLCRKAEELKDRWSLHPSQIVLNHCAVGEVGGTIHVLHNVRQNGVTSLVTEDTVVNSAQCEIAALDEYLHEPYTILKADIESYEYDMLLGAKKTICTQKPFLAISIYHNAVDLYSIPLLIHSLVPEYHFSVMHHSQTFADTVLYCWCE